MTLPLTDPKKNAITEQLWNAILTGDPDRALSLLKKPRHAFLIHATDSGGYGVLHYAIYHQGYDGMFDDCIAWVIRHGADLEQRLTLKGHPFEGSTPLHFATQFGSLDQVKTLIEAGADINSKKKDGSSVIDLAEPNSDILAYLMEVQRVLQEKEQLGSVSQTASLASETSRKTSKVL